MFKEGKKKRWPGIRLFCWHLSLTTNELLQSGKLRTGFRKGSARGTGKLCPKVYFDNFPQMRLVNSWLRSNDLSSE